MTGEVLQYRDSIHLCTAWYHIHTYNNNCNSTDTDVNCTCKQKTVKTHKYSHTCTPLN